MVHAQHGWKDIQRNYRDRYEKGVVCIVLPIKATILTKVKR